MSTVKTYRVKGYMLISHDRLPTWQVFTKDVRAVNESDALEEIYSLMGSKHKLKRYHIRIESITEINPEESIDVVVRELARATRIVKP
ncbi:50S ribosomal protein L18a [Thermosphaera chiliense]|uniref:Large ribosomal subunit protein eL20 n=1 Tax=Thermosphaera chiliense TaxID=3402707 RepID=A0A7M1UT58_9CREN|nr:50S ribosomal protein L18Ae [Thermosphaera aggregans]QOR94797.1 50S ribosomal protein L18a [Thermosphaera aggregans]